MKSLHFRVFSPTAGVARMKQLQARDSLQPFQDYLSQAIRTAKERQVQLKLPWQQVRNQVQLTCHPLQTRLRVRRPKGRWSMEEWPVGVTPDPGQTLMVVNRSENISVEQCQQQGDRVLVTLESPLEPEDTVFWCGVQCSFEPEADAAAPEQFTDSAGQEFKVVDHQEEGPEHWLLTVDGRPAQGDIRLADSPLETEELQPLAGVRRLFDRKGRAFDLAAGLLRVEELPARGDLHSDTGLRFRWKREGKGRSGLWLQLKLPENGGELDDAAFIDPRALFCESEMKEVWTEKWYRKEHAIKILRVDSERYQIKVERLPPEGCLLHLPVNVRALELQRRALNQLQDCPLPGHEGLLRLCEAPKAVRWPEVTPGVIAPDEYRFLTDETRDGTRQQRGFVRVALGTPDLALMEGPPGSGKTTAICELVSKLARQGKRVLLCASTNVAIDNVLERLLDSEEEAVDAVRLGLPERVDNRVRGCCLDRRVEDLLEKWTEHPELGQRGADELRAMAERTVVAAANLTCATMAGVIHHPLLKAQAREDDRNWKKRKWAEPVTTCPHFDLLVVDEASKTLIQEFMVPALLARRWVVVGDVRQLPPFTERSHIQANLEGMLGERKQRKHSLLSTNAQRALAFRWRLGRPQLMHAGLPRWLLVEPGPVLDALELELVTRGEEIPVARVVRSKGKIHPGSPVMRISLDEVRDGSPAALHLAAARWVMVEEGLEQEVEELLPANLLISREPVGERGFLQETSPLLFRQQVWLRRLPRGGDFVRPLRDRGREIRTVQQLEQVERRWLERHSWAGEVTWRLLRHHELRRSRNQKQRERYGKDIDALRPEGNRAVEERIWEIHDIGLPSILEVIQEGLGEERTRRQSALSQGMRHGGKRNQVAFEARFESLSYQHRMHPQIAAFPREEIYRGADALKDANTIASRDRMVGWDFAAGEFRKRCVWMDVSGRESGGVNQDEVKAMEQVLRQFVAWAERRAPPPRDTHPARRWEVACLCFYVKQEKAIRGMLRKFTGQEQRHVRFELGDVEFTCGTVDRFQGKEADLVLLSMRNTRRVGFLDSLNRLNVAVTRARQQLVIIGKQRYFRGCPIDELESLARGTVTVHPQQKRRRGRRT